MAYPHSHFVNERVGPSARKNSKRRISFLGDFRQATDDQKGDAHRNERRTQAVGIVFSDGAQKIEDWHVIDVERKGMRGQPADELHDAIRFEFHRQVPGKNCATVKMKCDKQRENIIAPVIRGII